MIIFIAICVCIVILAMPLIVILATIPKVVNETCLVNMPLEPTTRHGWNYQKQRKLPSRNIEKEPVRNHGWDAGYCKWKEDGSIVFPIRSVKEIELGDATYIFKNDENGK